ncbi:peptidase associated/transthyretin-like domain-containing protein [Natronorubrum thiooxidans]|uniref:Uncharacterized protein n=1 Tax=Natronorubrum thiooxidans TaxID=308853 RepID=A0A1N7E2V3_9EURY|nr:hypothetical protein [Natronorubrum thiooxidans]SIR82358.1 hypothetical protein SAMN05421752_103156 [Natronorubrum thiooxidans]
MKRTQLLTVLVVVGLLVGSIPSAALAAGAAGTGANAVAQADESNSNSSEATTGQQLATVIEVTDDEVSGDIESASLESVLAQSNESERAAVLADRAASLRERANETVATQQEATTAYETGDLTRTEYAQRLAVLSSRANTVDRGFDRLDEHAADVSALELRAAGYDRSANDAAREQLRKLTSTGASALLAQYTGEQRGEFSLETTDGLSIETENEDGERSRELEREQPGNGTFQIPQSEALTAATDPLSTADEGEWTLRSVDRDEDDGYFEFEFTFFGPDTTGEAEVSVDGETGDVFEFEEELEPRDADDNDEIPLSISLVEGTAAPNTSVTFAVTAAGDPIEGATVEIDDQAVGETDATGRITVTLPDDDEADVEVEDGDREGELELTLRSTTSEEAADEEINEKLSVTGSVDNGTVTVAVGYDGEGVSGVTVLADGDRVGTTGEDGTLSFDAEPGDDELEVTVLKGEFEAELEFEISADGALELDDVDIDERDEDHEDDEELGVTVVSGEPAPGATVTLEVTDADGPVADAVVEVEDENAGTTDSDGRITVTLPDDDEVEIEVEDGDREGELDLEFDGDDSDDDARKEDDEDDEREEEDADDEDGEDADDDEEDADDEDGEDADDDEEDADDEDGEDADDDEENADEDEAEDDE